MKCYSDRLRECPIEVLKEMIARQKQQAELVRQDLETMIAVLAERKDNDEKTRYKQNCSATKEGDKG